MNEEVDIHIEKLINLTGVNKRYQIILVILAFLCFFNNMTAQSNIAVLFLTPVVKLDDGSITYLNYTICQSQNYEIIAESGASLVTETNIQCDRKSMTILSLSFFIGGIIAAFFFKFFMDRYGRKVTIITWQVFFIIFNITITITFSYKFVWIFINLLFISFSSSLTNYPIFLMALEHLNAKYRFPLGCIIINGLSFSALIFFMILGSITNWRNVFFVNAGIGLIITIIFMLYIKESPRYYLLTGKYRSFYEILEHISKINRTSLTFHEEYKSKENKAIKDDVKKFLKENRKIPLEENPLSSGKGILCFLLKNPKYKKTYLISLLMIFTNTGSYTVCNKTFKDLLKAYQMVAVSFIVSNSIQFILGLYIGFLANTRFGRKRTLFVLYILSAIGYLLFIIFKISPLSDKVVSIFCIFCKICSFLEMSICYNYVAEFLPTPIRSYSFGFFTAVGYLGTIIFLPLQFFLRTLGVFIVFLIFGALNIVFVTYLPETMGMSLREDIGPIILKKLDNQDDKLINNDVEEESLTNNNITETDNNQKVKEQKEKNNDDKYIEVDNRDPLLIKEEAQVKNDESN